LNVEFSFIILTYNEEIHLPRLLQSIKSLDVKVYILDSGSKDSTIQIATEFGAEIKTNPFENHPKQWDFALKNFNITTPWIICLDADQIVTPQLLERLNTFKDEENKDVDGIYFIRKNYFKNKWIKHGGYFPFYLLKMVRFNSVFSDLNENMDHRFIVNGKTKIWKDGFVIEENLKENKISFWIEKHNRYSDLVAIEEVERMKQLRLQTIKPRFWGSPDERTAWLKQLWWKMPRIVRPMIYFLYRMTFQLGILDGTTGIIFHFLQGFWFRLIVDIKIDEILQSEKKAEELQADENKKTIRFVISFLMLFLFFYYFNIWYFSVTSAFSEHYNHILGEYFNYIHILRRTLLLSSVQILDWLGFPSISDEYHLLISGHGSLNLVYSCLGLGVISFFSAFVLSYPKSLKTKIIFLGTGVFAIELLNVFRFVFLGIFWDKKEGKIIDHHVVFNLFIYILISLSLYLWVKGDISKAKKNEAN